MIYVLVSICAITILSVCLIIGIEITGNYLQKSFVVIKYWLSAHKIGNSKAWFDCHKLVLILLDV